MKASKGFFDASKSVLIAMADMTRLFTATRYFDRFKMSRKDNTKSF